MDDRPRRPGPPPGTAARRTPSRSRSPATPIPAPRRGLSRPLPWCPGAELKLSLDLDLTARPEEGTYMEWRNEEFDLGGVDHLALVCSDMKRTVEFYTQVLGMRLIKTINLPGGAGQHFFFDMGGGNALAFFWFPDAPDPVPGVSAPVTVPGLGEWTSAVGSMNHVAFNVPEDRFLEYRAKLKAKGVRVSPIIDHDDSESGVARELHPGVFVRSYYFQDPDGILLEFACWRRAMGQPGDVRHEPKTAADRAGVRV